MQGQNVVGPMVVQVAREELFLGIFGNFNFVSAADSINNNCCCLLSSSAASQQKRQGQKISL